MLARSLHLCPAPQALMLASLKQLSTGLDTDTLTRTIFLRREKMMGQVASGQRTRTPDIERAT